VDLDRLSLFKDIARERSITRGADGSSISQSAASQHVQDLERSFGVRLLDRSTRPLKLTAAGQEYYQFCRDVLRRKEEFDAALDRVKQTVEGSVHVASIYSIGLSEMSRWEESFRRQYPDAELAVEFLRPNRVYEAIRTDRADIGLVSYPEPSRDLTVVPWRKEVMIVAARPDHPLALNTFISPAALRGHAFIGFDDDLPIARELRRYLRESGAEVNRVMQFDNVLMIKEAVALGTGISILPERVIAEDIAQDRLIGIPLESPGLYRPLGIIHRRRKRFTPAAKAFLEQLQ
jgi:DNA-binding transcriptional LysR family regulator